MFRCFSIGFPLPPVMVKEWCTNPHDHTSARLLLDSYHHLAMPFENISPILITVLSPEHKFLTLSQLLFLMILISVHRQMHFLSALCAKVKKGRHCTISHNTMVPTQNRIGSPAKRSSPRWKPLILHYFPMSNLKTMAFQS